MNTKLITASVIAGLVGGVAVYFMTLLIKPDSDKVAYIVSQKIFDDYNGTKEIKKKIARLEEQQKTMIDSMVLEVKALEIKFGEKDERVIKSKMKYNQVYSQTLENNQQKMQEYNEGIWRQLNQYVAEYGKENNYRIIYGANGSGTLMHIDESMNITEEVTAYTNRKYADN